MSTKDVSHSLSTSLPYTVFSRNRRCFFTYLLGYLTLASSLTATIYFPLIDLLTSQYKASTQLVNLTITFYVIFQAISPAFWAPVSDTLGRRPVFLITFSIYACASLGLALNKANYTALLLCRGLQSIGGSAVMSLAYAVVADISPHSERGRILGPMLTSTNLGPCVGPVIGGGAILASGDVMWCFWVLAIFGITSLLLIGWTLPETARTVVGNGAVHPQGIWRTWSSMLSEKFSKSKNHTTSDLTAPEEVADINAGKTGKGKWTIPNPFISLEIIFYWDTILILWMAASPYTVWYCIQTSLPLIYGNTYGYNDLFVGLCFLPGGFGVILGGLIAGYLMDMDYKHTTRALGLEGNDQLVDRNQFPFEKARSRGSFTIISISIPLLVGYGWAVQFHVHPSVPLILQALIGAKCTVVLQNFSALLVDIFPERPGAAAAANNITRCALSAAAVAALQPLSKEIGRSWLFTLIALVDGGGGLLAVWALRRWGSAWRDKRDSRCTR
jgi:MFS family permease